MTTPVPVTAARASSVLDGQRAANGAQHLCSTAAAAQCWRSAPAKGGSHRLELQLGAPAVVRALRIQFQGGFAARSIGVRLRDAASGEWVDGGSVAPEDSNRAQVVELDGSDGGAAISAVRLRLFEMSDLFGRCVVLVS